jgi:hypothetical protein
LFLSSQIQVHQKIKLLEQRTGMTRHWRSVPDFDKDQDRDVRWGFIQESERAKQQQQQQQQQNERNYQDQ